MLLASNKVLWVRKEPKTTGGGRGWLDRQAAFLCCLVIAGSLTVVFSLGTSLLTGVGLS